MNQLNDEELAAVLQGAVPEPPDDLPGRAERARDEARRIRVRRRAAVLASAVAVAVLVTVPAVVLSGADDTTGVADVPAPCTGVDCDTALIAEAIRKPLDLPKLAPGEACPVSPVNTFPAGAGFSSRFKAIGTGPLYLTGAGVVTLTPGQASQKVIWVVEAGYGGPLLLRGGRIDSAGRLDFIHYIGAAGYTGGAGDDTPHGTLLYPRSATGETPPRVMQDYPSGIYVDEPGCYAVQVDGEGFSETLVFRVVR